MPDHDQPILEDARLFHHGVQLFNQREWFEAHEVWEDLWHRLGGPHKRFVQGLIQLAVTLEHARRGNPRGVRALWTSCQNKFHDLPDPYCGLHHAQLRNQLHLAIQPVLDLPPERFQPGLPHGQHLPTRWNHVPTLTLSYDPFHSPAGLHDASDSEWAQLRNH